MLGLQRVVWACDYPWGGSGRLIEWNEHLAYLRIQVIPCPFPDLKASGNEPKPACGQRGSLSGRSAWPKPGPNLTLGCIFSIRSDTGSSCAKSLPTPPTRVSPPFPPVSPLLAVGLREVAQTFQDFASMKWRLVEAYGFVFVEEMKEQAFAQFALGPEPEKDGHFTPGAGSTAGTPRWGWPTC